MSPVEPVRVTLSSHTLKYLLAGNNWQMSLPGSRYLFLLYELLVISQGKDLVITDTEHVSRLQIKSHFGA